MLANSVTNMDYRFDGKNTSPRSRFYSFEYAHTCTGYYKNLIPTTSSLNAQSLAAFSYRVIHVSKVPRQVVNSLKSTHVVNFGRELIIGDLAVNQVRARLVFDSGVERRDDIAGGERPTSDVR